MPRARRNPPDGPGVSSAADSPGPGTDADGSLARYLAKRSAERSPEPFGGGGGTGAGVFVVHKHEATRLHYDLRLELGGTLLSWAVPKGISPDPADKKLAMHVEDHPIDYMEFEDVIPKGEYGGGPMIVWDLGRWIPLEDPERGLETGKLLFELRGYKLNGVWTLVKIAKGETGREWLLIREARGGHPVLPDRSLPETSVLSGLTVEELGRTESGWSPATEVMEAAREAGAKAGVVDPGTLDLQLAMARQDPFDDPRWQFELKLDGYRMVAATAGSRRARPFLRTRAGHDAGPSFPELMRPLRKIPYPGLVLDGETVMTDEQGRPSFQRLQARARFRRAADVRAVSLGDPATFFAFDMLAIGDLDLRGLPLRERRRLLRTVIPEAGPIRISEEFPGTAGRSLFDQVARMGMEGVMAKRLDSKYTAGRSESWLKIHANRKGLFAVVGHTLPAGSRSGLGALHVAAYSPSGAGNPVLRYRGRVGTGLTEAVLVDLAEHLAGRVVDDPVAEGAPRGPDHRWVEPELVAEIEFKELTSEGLLRLPVFLNLVDTPLADCVGPLPRRETLAQVDTAAPPPEEVPVSNPNKVFWPGEGYTKGDLVDYYREIAPFMLPHLSERPLVLTRYPDGIEGKSFFQKNAAAGQPEWVRTETVSGGSERDIEYFIADSASALVYLANLAAIPLHVWSSRVTDLEKPDWCLLDLDPKHRQGGREVTLSFGTVVQVALAVRSVCDEIGLPCYPKTSGSSGIHVLVPLGGQLPHNQARALGLLMARAVVERAGNLATIERSPDRRRGKVYIDYVQNGRGRLCASAYCVRPRTGATVSAPLLWDEVNDKLSMTDFTIQTMPARARELNDPLLPVLTERPDLVRAVSALESLLA